MLTRDIHRFKNLGLNLNKDNKGTFIDDELNKIIEYLQRKVLPKLKEIEESGILTDGQKGQILGVRNKYLKWLNLENKENVKINVNKINTKGVGNGIVYYNRGKWKSISPIYNGNYIVSFHKGNINFKSVNTIKIIYKNVAIGKGVINSINNVFNGDFLKEVNDIKLNTTVNPDRINFIITKRGLLKYAKYKPHKKLFLLKKLKSGEFRDLKKVKGNNFLNHIIRKLYSDDVLKGTIIKYYLENSGNFKDNGNYIRLTEKIQGDVDTNFNLQHIDKDVFKYTSSDLYRDFIFQKLVDSQGEPTRIINRKILEVSPILPMEWKEAGYKGPPRPLDLTWDGCRGENIILGSLELADVEKAYDKDVYDAIMKYIREHPQK